MEKNNQNKFPAVKVKTQEDFIRFIDELVADYRKNKNEWENKTLIDFIEAIKRYTSDVDGFYSNLKIKNKVGEPDWGKFAQILAGATRYE